MLDPDSPSLQQRRSARARLAADLVAYAAGVAREDIFRSARGGARPATVARHVAMYLAHTVFSWSLHHVGVAFERDRSTVSYACRQVEDMRDDAKFDAWLERLEEALAAAPPPPVEAELPRALARTPAAPVATRRYVRTA